MLCILAFPGGVKFVEISPNFVVLTAMEQTWGSEFVRLSQVSLITWEIESD